ncbi:MAG: hypothetical protein VR68_06430 [Peptococcaceae bacterium BRH_c4a]|nr:MAG: hypothetical protein VR68_06430 [Peptococcaceae bacterium BRH_c4a]
MRLLKIIAPLILVLLMAGCWGKRETDEIAYVLVMGFDKGPGHFSVISFQIANPKAIAGLSGGGGGKGVGGGDEPLFIENIVAKLPIGAFNLLNVERSREISLLHTTAFIFSEEVARQGVAHYLNPLGRYRETRGTAFVFVCRGKASEFMKKNQPVLEVTPSKQYAMLALTNKIHGLTQVTQFTDFYQGSKSVDVNPTAPLVGISKKEELSKSEIPPHNKLGDYLAGDMPSVEKDPQFIGTAVFRKDRMVGELTGDETRYFNMIIGKLNQSFLIIDDPKKKGQSVGMTLRQARKPEVKVNLAGERPEIELRIYQEPEIAGVTSGINYESPEMKKVLEKALANIIRKRCESLITRTQEEFRSDIFGFGRKAKRKFITLEKWKKYNWDEAFPQARVDIIVHVKIRRTGLMLNTRPTQ